ncbi:MAG: zf-TFIIB domain-containing protein [Candidatus Krumholzibacteria bacterium]
MNCPGCNYPLIVLEVEGVEIDHCLACSGVWLDAGELGLLLADAANKDELMQSLAAGVQGKEKKIRCPICRKHLEKVDYGTEKKVRLDKCPNNDGLWFDRGELLDMINMGEFPVDNRVFILLHQVFGDKSQV